MSGTHGVLQPNQPGYFYITLEESYVALFKSSAEKWLKEHKDEEDAEKLAAARAAHAVAKAYITDVLVHLSNDLYSKTRSEKNLWVFLSFPQLETRLHGGCKMRTLKDAMKEMIEDAYVFKQPNRDPRYKSLEYRLNLPKYRKELIELPKKVDKDDSANLHDEIEENDSSQNDSANTHDDSANLHDHDANLHDDSANLHAIHNTDITNTEHTHNKDTYSDTNHSQNSNTSPNGDTLSLFQEITNRFGGVEQVRSLLEKLLTQEQQLPTSNTQDKPTSTEADEQASYSQPATQNELPSTPALSKEESKKTETLKEVKPRQPLQEPDESMPWGVEKAMVWANYFRKFAYPVKNHANSKHRKALEAAETIIQRDIPEKKFVYVFKYMKGGLLPNKLESDYWSTKEVDIWTVNDHYENQKDEINRKRAERQQASGKGSTQSLAESINPDRTFDNGLKYFSHVFTPSTLVAAGSK